MHFKGLLWLLLEREQCEAQDWNEGDGDHKSESHRVTQERDRDSGTLGENDCSGYLLLWNKSPENLVAYNNHYFIICHIFL